MDLKFKGGNATLQYNERPARKSSRWILLKDFNHQKLALTKRRKLPSSEHNPLKIVLTSGFKKKMESKSRKSYAQACDLNFDCNSSEKAKKLNDTEKITRKSSTTKNVKIKNSPRRFSQDFILFEPDKDGKTSFPNDNSFRSFRKIRDGFYKLFDDWKKWHNQTNFQYQKKDEFKFKIKFLENSCNGNLYHFGKLFVSQMIQTCVFGSIEENKNSEQLKSLIDDHKLRKLERRIGLKNSPHSGTSMSFVDKELFFFELILNFNNPTFFKYLKLILIQKIEESNDFVNILESENLQVKCDDSFKMSFNTISSTLQLLAKFLGYLEFSSYQIDITETCGPFIDNLISLRNREPCCLDIAYYIKNCIKKKQIVLTLPWVIVFLKQMDPLAPYLEFYQCCLKLVIYIIQDLKNDAINCHHSIKMYLLKLSEPFIESYIKFLSPKLSKVDNISDKETIALDTFDGLIDESFLRETSLFYKVNDSSDQQSRSERIIAPRRITPMNLKQASYDTEDKTNNFITKDINTEFKYYFSDMNPLPLRKICEFVSEKIFNKCTKEVRCFLLNKIKESYNCDKENSFNDENSLNESDSSLKSKTKFRRYSNLSLEDINSLKTNCSTFIHSFCLKKIRKALNCLIYSEDYSINVIEIAIHISVNICSGKCCNWIVSYIDNKEFIKDLEAEGRITNNIYTDKTYILYDIRETICQLHVNHKESKSLEELEVLLHEMIEWKIEINEDGSNRLIDLSAIDLLIGIILRYSNEFINDCNNIYIIMDCFVKLWSNSDLQYIICPRNIYILSDSNNWLALGKVIKYLINTSIYKISSFISECEWTQECLQDIETKQRLTNLMENIL